MATIIIRRLDQSLKDRLKVRAAEHGRSMEEEAREILKSSLASDPSSELNLVEAIRRRFAPLGGVELTIPPRDAGRQPPTFE